ncbi:MAG TPA: TonB family protein [Terriglobales bacterium]|nr:TonB family protein [Terriglobales bacterium]
MGAAQGSVASELEQARTAPKFGAHTPLAEKLLAVAIRAQNFTGSSGVAIALSEAQGMVCRANWGTSAPEIGAKLNTENSFTGLCVRTGEALRCDDAETDPRVDAEACRALGISAIAVAPVRRGVKVIGVIAAFSDTPHTFTEKHLLILTTLAEVIVELLDDPHPVPLPPGLEAAPELAQATGVSTASLASQLDQPRTASLIKQPVELPVEDAPAAAPPAPPTPEKVAEMPAQRDRTSDKAAADRDTEVWPSPKGPGPLPQQPKTAPPLSGNKAAAAADAGASRLKLVKKVASPQPDFGSELTLSSFEADASTPRRWLLPVAILAIFALIAFVSWRLHESKRAGMERQAPAMATPAPQASQPEPLEPAKAAPVEPEPEAAPAPPKAKLTPSAVKTKPASERLDEAEDVTVRRVPQPVIEDAGPVRRPTVTLQKAQTPEAPQLAMGAPELPAGLTKPATTYVAGPVSRLIPARLDRRVEPPYPDAARRMGIAGAVVMKATITRTGTVGSLQWLSGNEIFRDTTIAAVKQWRYKPATLNGQPVESDLEIVLNFSKK